MSIKKMISTVTVMAMVFFGVGMGLVLATPQQAQAGSHFFRGFRQNAAGGYSGGSRRVLRSQEGAFYKNGYRFRSDGEGNVIGGHSKGYETPNGATVARGGAFQRNADGSFSRVHGVTMNGEKGTYNSSGSLNKSADGELTASRNTNATGANGASYQGNTNYDPETGLTHSGTCYNQSGEQVPCPKQ